MLSEWRKVKKEVTAIMLTITIMTMSSAMAAPLDVSVEEKFNTTVDFDGTSYSYTTDVTGFINITNKGSDDLLDIWVVIDLNNATGLNVAFENASSQVFVYTSIPATMKQSVQKNLNTSGATHYVHIPHLRPNELVSLSYDVDDSALGIANSAPFLIDESYNVSKIPTNRNVAWKVHLNITLNQSFFSAFPVTPDVQMDVYKYLSNDPTYYGSSNWTSLGPISNPSTNKGTANTANGGWGTVDPDELDVTGIKLNTTAQQNKYVNISFDVNGNNSGTGGHAYFLDKFGFAAISFSFNGNVSGTKILDVFSFGNASVSVNKTGPLYNNTLNDWVDWKGNATITNRASGLTYVVRNVTMWATAAGSFNNIIYGPQEFKPNQQIGPNGFYKTPDIRFNYSSVPVIWANATFELIKSTSSGWYTNYTSMSEYNATFGSEYIVIEKIWVIGTYLVKVTKHVIPNATNNVFDVYLVVENLGGQKSPYVYVYDMIPLNFSEYNWDSDWTDVKEDGNWVNKSSMYAGNGSVASPMSGYHTGYWWRLNPLNGGADGDGSYTDYAEIANNQSVVIFYQINGIGEFRPMDVFIVGIDPMLSMNEQTSPRITIVSGSATSSYETLIAAVTCTLGVVALILLRRE